MIVEDLDDDEVIHLSNSGAGIFSFSIVETNVWLIISFPGRHCSCFNEAYIMSYPLHSTPENFISSVCLLWADDNKSAEENSKKVVGFGVSNTLFV